MSKDELLSIDDLIKQLDDTEEKKEVSKIKEPKHLSSVIDFNGFKVDTEDDSALLAMVLVSALDDKNKADDLYDVFKTMVEYSKDRSDSSKEALAEMVKARIGATSNLVKILDIKNKSKQGGNSLVNLQISPNKAGIDLKNITDNLD